MRDRKYPAEENKMRTAFTRYQRAISNNNGFICGYDVAHFFYANLHTFYSWVFVCSPRHSRPIDNASEQQRNNQLSHFLWWNVFFETHNNFYLPKWPQLHFISCQELSKLPQKITTCFMLVREPLKNWLRYEQRAAFQKIIKRNSKLWHYVTIPQTINLYQIIPSYFLPFKKLFLIKTYLYPSVFIK